MSTVLHGVSSRVQTASRERDLRVPFPGVGGGALNRKALWVFCGVVCLTVTSYGSTVTYTEIAPIGVTCPVLTAAQGTCTNAPGFITTAVSLSAFSTTGATMAGLRVTAQFTDGFSQTLVWAATGALSGGVSQATGTHQWSLSNAGDTFTTDFILTNGAGSTSNITNIIVSGIGGVNASGQATVFDRTSVPNTSGTANEQTPGSHSGHDLSITSGTLNTYSVLVTYSNIFAITSSNTCTNSGAGSNNQRTTSPCADEWANLTIHFNSGAGIGNFTPNSLFNFMQDADNTNGPLVTPEPATLSLLVAGLLAGILSLRRRRSRRLASLVNCSSPVDVVTAKH